MPENLKKIISNILITYNEVILLAILSEIDAKAMSLPIREQLVQRRVGQSTLVLLH